ncbi:apolipoprotein N-acyltransferase [Herbaspirillum sp. alder98]|uniref:apolipoprotein N-acyltransferase n=1 Tax=Herbaspirillum sp. alder98 TaxID=2913096 RepID=UPI001CD85C9F|nr:apolipoprotein N-acyltransferase [Herbaspirillum sp. alder98]MCA1325184.1 apolipoprotein N-acyltransferase [Herbaspirillum sp. alder98]
MNSLIPNKLPGAPALLAIAAGALNVLAFAPFGLWPLQILALAWLFHGIVATPQAGARRHFVRAWLYGFGWSAASVHWLYISMHDYGGMPGWMAALAVALLALYVGLYAGAAAALAVWLRGRWSSSPRILGLLILPALWALSEWLRGWIFTGFPWLVSGYAHTTGPLAGFAPLAGVYGVGWVAALIAGALALLYQALRRRGNVAGAMRLGLPLATVLVMLAAGLLLRTVAWTAPAGAPISVRLLQGNVPQEMKFSNEALVSTLSMYEQMISAAPADLIATPETAIPLLPQQLPPDYLERLARFVQHSGSHLMLGIPLSDSPQQYANGVLGFSPDTTSGGMPYRYDKHHLVPFGEFIPPGFRWFVDMMSIPLGDMTRGGPTQAPLAVKDQWVLPNICYEDLFGEEIAGQLRSAYREGRPQASILLNLSNIAWFGDSIALPQHLQISQMRTLETGRPMLRATNTGATAVILPGNGTPQELTPFTRGVLSASVPGYSGQTPYILLGNALVVGLSLLMLLVAWGRNKAARLRH